MIKKLNLKKERDYLASFNEAQKENKFEEKSKQINSLIERWVNNLKQVENLVTKEQVYKADKLLKDIGKQIVGSDIAAIFYGKG